MLTQNYFYQLVTKIWSQNGFVCTVWFSTKKSSFWVKLDAKKRFYDSFPLIMYTQSNLCHGEKFKSYSGRYISEISGLTPQLSVQRLNSSPVSLRSDNRVQFLHRPWQLIVPYYLEFNLNLRISNLQIVYSYFHQNKLII